MIEWSTLKKLIWLKKQGGAATVWNIVTGVSPLSLPNAIAHAIRSLIQYGKCVQSSTPTPSAPVDIMCNNGVLRYGALGSNLIDPSAANTILGHYIDRLTGEIGSSVANFMFAGYVPVEAGKTYVAYGRAKSGNDLSDYNRVAWYDSTKTWISGADYTQNRIAVVTAPANAAYARFSCNPTGTTTTVVTQELVDSYNWTFAEGTAEITPFVPFVGGVLADGTPEVLTVSAISSIQSANIVDAKGLDSRTGVVVSNSDRCYTRLGYYSAGATIVQRATDNKLGGYLYIYNSDTPSTESFIETVSMSTAVEVDGWYERSATSTSDGYLFIQSLANKSASLGINWSATQPLQTVTDIPMLLSVGDYKDTAEIISGIKTGKVGVKVFDGTETIGTSNACFTIAISDRVTSKTALLCSHFPYSSKTSSQTDDCTIISFSSTNIGFRYDACATKEDFAAWLASEYAKGTPVIVLYPLATEQTEHTTPQPLSTVEGDNTVTWTAEVSGTVKQVEYAKAAPSGDNLVGTAVVGTAQAG